MLLTTIEKVSSFFANFYCGSDISSSLDVTNFLMPLSPLGFVIFPTGILHKGPANTKNSVIQISIWLLRKRSRLICINPTPTFKYHLQIRNVCMDWQPVGVLMPLLLE